MLWERERSETGVGQQDQTDTGDSSSGNTGKATERERRGRRGRRGRERGTLTGRVKRTRQHLLHPSHLHPLSCPVQYFGVGHERGGVCYGRERHKVSKVRKTHKPHQHVTKKDKEMTPQVIRSRMQQTMLIFHNLCITLGSWVISLDSSPYRI